MGTVATDVVEGYEHANDDAEELKIKSKQRPTWQRLFNQKVLVKWERESD